MKSSTQFRAIRPDESDLFTFDFSSSIGTATISTATVACVVASDSPGLDATPALRVLSTPSIAGGLVTVLCGTMVNGVVYLLTATARLSDSRILVKDGEVECSLRPLPTTIPTLTPAKFRLNFPTFADANAFPDEAIAFWLDVVSNRLPLDVNRWRDDLELGQQLYVAHMMILERQNQLVASRGLAPLAIGPAVSRSVGGVSVSYDLSSAYMEGAGFWNLTTYGQRYWYLINQAGMGPIQF